MQTDRPNAKTKLLDAALVVIRAKGYAATTVDELCQTAGVTKGAFFHHFRSKDDLAVAAADYWSETTGEFFGAAAYHHHEDPLDRVLAYVDFRKSIIQGDLPAFTCLVGTMVQETYDTNPAIRDACAASIVGHAGMLVADLEEAMQAHGIQADWTAESLALHTQAVIQGAFVVAKAKGEPHVAIESIAHLRRYIELLFETRRPEGQENAIHDTTTNP